METHLARGRLGEEIATRYLEEQGYTIHARNWQYRHREIDIVAQEGDELVIIEVKVRSTSPWGSAITAVDRGKRQRLVEAAGYYISQHRLTLSVRYDLIGIDIDREGKYRIEHARRAFYPTLSRPRSKSGRRRPY